MDWRPIIIAPRDGTYVLLYGDGCFAVGFWNGRSWDDGDFTIDLGAFSHWAPLVGPEVEQ